jgi:putative ABC transport system permease protein
MLLESFRQDVRIGLRVLIKEKSFCLLAITVLALGICGVTTQFTVVNAIVLRALSFPHPEQLMTIGLIDPLATPQNNNFGLGNIPFLQDYEDLRDSQHSFSQMAAYINGSTINVNYNGNPQRYTGGYVTDDFFRILGVAPMMGRDFSTADNKPGSPKTTILSHEIWRRDFGSNPNIVGQSLHINGKDAAVIGVMPPGFKFPVNEELWVALYNEYPVTPRGDFSKLGFPSVMGRLKAGVSVDSATAEFVGLAKRLAQENPKTNAQFTSASVQPLANNFTGVQFRQIVWSMLGAVILVLLIACVNVMNMQFGRCAIRGKELAIRGALGATRWRLVRQMLTESFLVAALGALLGVLLAYKALDLLVRATSSLSFPLPYWIVFKIDPIVLAVTVGATLIATLVSGFVPALLSARANAAEMMKEGGRGNTGRTVNIITRLLVVAQIALTATLLIAATLQIKSIRNQNKLDYGYDENGVYSARMGLMDGDYPSDEAKRQFFARLLRTLRANPAFSDAALSSRFRMTFGGFGQYEVDGQTYVTDRDRPQGNNEFVSDNYFSTLGIRVLQGRDFTIEDKDDKQPVAIVNTSFARKYWGNQSPLGHRVRVFNPAQPQAWRTIVGIVPDTLMQGPFNQQTDNSGFYVPILSAPPTPQFVTIVVRPQPGQRAEGVAAPLGRAVAAIDPNLPTYFAGTPAHLHDEILGFNRINANLFSIFGAVAVILSAVGLYGVMSFSVNQRTQEIGIRMALGADARRILRMIMNQGFAQLMIGLALGVTGAAVLLKLVGPAALQNFLFKVNALDPTIYTAVAALLGFVALASCLVPARRATRVNPIVALRAE